MSEPALLPPPKDPKTVERMRALFELRAAFAQLKQRVKARRGGEHEKDSRDPHIHVGR